MDRAATSIVLAMTITVTACVGGEWPDTPDQSIDQSIGGGATIGLAIEVDNGVPAPLQVKRGQTFYLNQIDIRSSTTSTVDEGVAGLRTRGEFASLAWGNVDREEEEFVLLPNADGTFTRRAFFRGASWMKARSIFRLEQLDARGKTLGWPITVDAGLDHDRRTSDDFFDRRFRAIQWTRDCRTSTDCTGATAFEEEALVELRNAMHPEQTFTIEPRTTALRRVWSMLPGRLYTIPVTQVAAPEFSYGFSIDVEALTPPRADGSYEPDSDITFRITLRDGAGKRLHPVGTLPSYNDVIFGANPAGIQYYRAFPGAFDPANAVWTEPVPDTWTHHIPADAPAGAHYVNVRGRRTYMGEDIPFSKTVEIQVAHRLVVLSRASISAGGANHFSSVRRVVIGPTRTVVSRAL